jgi:glutamate formiminotransferase
MGLYIECVPNISEGRDLEVVSTVAAEVEAVKGAYLLDKSSDADHNRSVITFAGEPDAVGEAAFRLVNRAASLIDLSKHEGKHPRMGATDVVPFIPLGEAQMEHCIRIAANVASRVGKELEIPVFMYEQAATREDRRNLASVRKGQFEGLREDIGTNPDRKPDFGPERIHPTAGATAVGAREFLIAYNVNLKSDNIEAARKIAKDIRESSGGLPAVKAIGLFLPELGIAQVSMNLVNFRATSMEAVYSDIERRAKDEYGIEVLESELIGLMPEAAYSQGLEDRLKIRDFKPDQIVEVRLRSAIAQTG